MPNKKGTIDDKIYLLGIIVFGVALAIMIPVVWNATLPVLNSFATPMMQPTLNKLSSANVITWVDVSFICAYFAFQIMISIILPYFVRHNILYLGIFIPASFIYSYAVIFVANAMQDYYASSGITMPLMSFVLNNLLVIEVVFFLLMMIIMFFPKDESSQGYYQ